MLCKFSLIAPLAMVRAYPSTALAQTDTMPKFHITIKHARVRQPRMNLTVPLDTMCKTEHCLLTCIDGLGNKYSVGLCM
jgi:hypothetical protein